MINSASNKINEATCFHCGEKCPSKVNFYQDKNFCCNGCMIVYEFLSSNNLNAYYSLEKNPGRKIESVESRDKYIYLDQDEVKNKFLLFSNDEISKVSFSIPQIHCSSCIWLLENLGRLNDGITYSIVNFPKRVAEITFKNNSISLRELVELLDAIGYKPDLKAHRTSSKQYTSDKSLIYKIGIAGFCFGNIMLLSFAEYLGMNEDFSGFQRFFGYLSLMLSLPVFFYSGMDYLVSAYKGLRYKFMNIDIPISLGMITLLARSSYEIISGSGAGYFDSLSGLIFFLLIGKWFQQKTYDSLSFDRDYKSYFPIAVNKISGDEKVSTQLEQIKIGDIVELRNGELIPSDSVLKNGVAFIDYSFVTGESAPVRKSKGELLYAGGRQFGPIIKVEIIKEVNNSYLTQLWNQDVFKKKKSADLNVTINKISKHFTIVILLIAIATGIYWSIQDSEKIWSSIAAVLIVACPCALALSVPFTLGNMTRIFGQNGLYLKNSNVIEKMAKISSIVMDKTGTITNQESQSISFSGSHLSTDDQQAIYACTSNSLHPLSLAISDSLNPIQHANIEEFDELPGLGISGKYNGLNVQMGSASYMSIESEDDLKQASQVFVSIDGVLKGKFTLNHTYRDGLKNVVKNLKQNYHLNLVSGDNDHQKDSLINDFGFESLYFDQSPMDKLNHVKNLQNERQKVMMIGDGLNDAGALKQSDVGLAVSDDVHQFSPACDVILNSDNFENIHLFMKLSKLSMKIIYISFGISFLYNIVGLSFAVSGNLSPIVAAILMPVSSISVVTFVSLATRWVSNRVMLPTPNKRSIEG